MFILRRYVYKIHFLINPALGSLRTDLQKEATVTMKFCTILLCAIICIVYICGLAHGQVLPYPGDCTKYQQCDASGCFVLSCGPGTEFNPATGTCDYPLQNRENCGNRY